MNDGFVRRAKEAIHTNDAIANFNIGSLHPTLRLAKTRADEIRNSLSVDPLGTEWEILLPAIEHSREKLADYLNADKRQLFLPRNNTRAVTEWAFNMAWTKNQKIVMTNQEYFRYRPLFDGLANEFSISIQEVELPTYTDRPDLTKEELLAHFSSHLDQGATHMFVSHVSAVTGFILPVRELCQLAQQKGVYAAIDGAHAPGQIPLDLSQLGADFYVGNLHKWLMGLCPSAFFYVKDLAQHPWRPRFSSDLGNYKLDEIFESDFAFGTNRIQMNMEYQGTEDRTALAVVKEVMEAREALGEQEILNSSAYIREQLAQQIQDLGIPLISYPDGAFSSFLLTFDLSPLNRVRAWQWFREHGFEVAFVPYGGRTVMRLSAACFLTKKDVSGLVSAIKTFKKAPH